LQISVPSISFYYLSLFLELFTCPPSSCLPPVSMGSIVGTATKYLLCQTIPLSDHHKHINTPLQILKPYHLFPTYLSTLRSTNLWSPKYLAYFIDYLLCANKIGHYSPKLSCYILTSVSLTLLFFQLKCPSSISFYLCPFVHLRGYCGMKRGPFTLILHP
jgi:hypothetical protein